MEGFRLATNTPNTPKPANNKRSCVGGGFPSRSRSSAGGCFPSHNKICPNKTNHANHKRSSVGGGSPSRNNHSQRSKPCKPYTRHAIQAPHVILELRGWGAFLHALSTPNGTNPANQKRSSVGGCIPSCNKHSKRSQACTP